MKTAPAINRLALANPRVITRATTLPTVLAAKGSRWSRMRQWVHKNSLGVNFAACALLVAGWAVHPQFIENPKAVDRLDGRPAVLTAGSEKYEVKEAGPYAKGWWGQLASGALTSHRYIVYKNPKDTKADNDGWVRLTLIAGNAKHTPQGDQYWTNAWSHRGASETLTVTVADGSGNPLPQNILALPREVAMPAQTKIRVQSGGQVKTAAVHPEAILTSKGTPGLKWFDPRNWLGNESYGPHQVTLQTFDGRRIAVTKDMLVEGSKGTVVRTGNTVYTINGRLQQHLADLLL